MKSTHIDRKNEFLMKANKVRQVLKKQNIEGIVFQEQKNLSWLTSGRFYVNMASERGVASVLVTLDSTVLISSNIEAKRLLEEETGHVFDHIEEYPWFDPAQMMERINQYVSTAGMRFDHSLEDEIKELRTVLGKREIEQIIVLGQDASEAMEETALKLDVGDSEQKIAAQLAYSFLVRGIEPVVNLIAVDQRVFSRRHPLPTELKCKKYTMLVGAGRRNGQIISLTRLVHFDQPPDELVLRHRAVASIDAHLIALARPGILFADLFSKLRESYGLAGFEEEWKLHHQGGLSGYIGREQLLMSNVQRAVQENQVFAWNPSITGVKSEDTILITEKQNHILTPVKRIPTVKIQIGERLIERPGILIR